MENELVLTPEQTQALTQIRERGWEKVGEPQAILKGDGAVCVRVEYAGGVEMFLVIEPDGYTHS